MQNLYDDKRGAPAPKYTDAEILYRNRLLNNLQQCYNTREQPQMELNDMGYSQYYLINRQSDMAYNPPRTNPLDSRIVTGIVHEKDNTIESLIASMNLQPKVVQFDENDKEMEDVSVYLTAKLKKALKQQDFTVLQSQLARVNISQGNVFALVQEKKNITVDKKVVGDPMKGKIVTTVVDNGKVCETMLIPNTSVFFPNLLEADLHKQPYIYVVMHMPRVIVEQQYKDFPNWKCVPKFPTTTVPQNVSGNWGDYYLQQPQKDYVEIIMFQSEISNEYNVLINGVMMYPVSDTGFPLTEFSLSGKYTVIKGDSEKIPFYAYGKSFPFKNEVKESIANELLRMMIHKLRYSSFPTLGNNSDKVLTSDIWAPSTVIPDLSRKDVEVLFPDMRIEPSDFSFYQLIMSSIDETSVSKSVEGTNQQDTTATQYVDQKKENLKKLGIVIDGFMQFLKEIYWLTLVYEIEKMDEKTNRYSTKDEKEMPMYDSFTAMEDVGGSQTEVSFNLTDEVTMTPEELFKHEFQAEKPVKSIYVKPKEAKEMLKKLRDKMYIKVVSEPEGQNQSLLGILFNTLTQYQNLQGKPIPNLNFEYLDKIVGDNSGFQSGKIFTKVIPQQVIQPEMMGVPNAAKAPQNSILANASNTITPM